MSSRFISKCFPKKRRCNRNVSLLARPWLQSGMWLCLYCSCSCSPRGTVIWSRERAVRCGNGLWRSNNYPFPLCYKEGGRNDMLRHQSKKVSREQLDLWMELEVRVCEGGRERGKKGRVWGKKETVDSNQMATEAKPCHMARGFLDLLCLERKARHLLLHSIHTCLKSAHWTPAQSLSQLIYLPVLYFLKLEDESKLVEEHKWLVKSKTITHIHRLSSCVQCGPIFYQKEGCSGLEKLV